MEELSTIFGAVEYYQAKTRRKAFSTWDEVPPL